MPTEFIAADAIDRIAALVEKSTDVKVISIASPEDAAGLPATIDVAIVPAAGGGPSKLVSLKTFFEEWRDRPAEKRGTAHVTTLASFSDLTNRHSTPHSAIFAVTDWRAPRLTAVIDYHEIDVVPEIESVEITPPESVDPVDAVEMMTAFVHRTPRPGNLTHRIVYAFPLSEAWKAWIGKDGEVMEQGDFAGWIEDRIMDLAAPTEEEARTFGDLFQTTFAAPSTLVQLSRGLQVTVEARVKSVSNLQNGAAQIIFEEEHRDVGGQPLTVPGLFMLSLPLFAGGEVARVPARLRYRISGGRPKWFYQLFRPDDATADVVTKAITKTGEATGLPVYEGTPEA